MHLDSSTDWRQAFPSRGPQVELWVRWLWVGLSSIALFLLVSVVATQPSPGSVRLAATLLLIVVASALLGAFLRSCWLPTAGAQVGDDWALHPGVTSALRRLGRALEEGLDQRALLELIARSSLEITRGDSCLLTLPEGTSLRVDRSGARWIEAGSGKPLRAGTAPRLEPEAGVRTELRALGETIGTLRVWPRAGRCFGPRVEAALAFFAAEAAVAVRDAALLSNARDHATALESKISDLERWQKQLDVYATDLARTYGELNQTRSVLDETYMATLEALAGAVDARDRYTYGHCRRVAELASRIAEEMGMSRRDRQSLEQVALLHDIGKIGVPDAVLRKTTPLTQEDWAAIQQHPELGFKMLSGLRFLGGALAAIRHHHERFDGTGYPDRLAGEQIPVMARILAVADAYDAITSDRPYRPGRSMEQGLAEIERSRYSYFDPIVADALLRIMASPGCRPGPETPVPDARLQGERTLAGTAVS